MQPLQLNFDLGVNGAPNDNVVHLLKIYQNAPYDQTIQIKSEDGTYTRDFTGYDNMVLQARKRQDSDLMFELNALAGHIIGTTTGLRIAFPASITKNLELNRSSTAASETNFVYDLVFILGGVVVERFAQGTGIIVASTTRLP